MKYNLKHKLLSLTGANQLFSIETRLRKIEKLLQGILVDNYLSQNLLKDERYDNPRSLSRYYNSIYSQNGEDGIIAEIFRRIGSKHNTFVEFGVHGFDNNSTMLIHKGWNGLWIEGDRKNYEAMRAKISEYEIDSLSLEYSLVTAENFESILDSKNIPTDFDLLSIDIDGNDYYVFESMEKFKPGVLVIEYNSTFGPSENIVIKYDPHFKWNGTSYFGSSLKALENMGLKKGYCLVCCDFSGSNAFFVRNDLVQDKFLDPYTSEFHYERPRYFIASPSGHFPDFGKFSK